MDLSELFMARYGYVVACARRYVLSPEQVEDVVQQVYVKFVSHHRHWDVNTDIAPLLYQITKNTALTYNEELYRHSPRRLQEIAELFAAKEIDVDGKTTNHSDLEEELFAMEECLQGLSPRKKELIDMHYQQKTSIRAIARLLGAKEKTVSKTVCRIREALRKCIELRLKSL